MHQLSLDHTPATDPAITQVWEVELDRIRAEEKRLNEETRDRVRWAFVDGIVIPATTFNLSHAPASGEGLEEWAGAIRRWEPELPHTFYVNVHEVSLMRGGPEEGGWWYDAGVPVSCTGPWTTVERAMQVKEARQEEADAANEGRRPMHSVIGDSEQQVSIDERPAVSYPTVRPHYE